MSRPQTSCGRKPHDFPEPPPHPIALHSASDLLRYGESDAYRTVVVSFTCLQHERRGCRPKSACSGEEIGPLPQSLHGSRKNGASGAQPLTAARTARGHHLASAGGRHACAEPVTALAHELARLVGPLHGMVSAAGRRTAEGSVARRGGFRARKTPSIRDRRGFKSGAAYTGGRPCSSMRAGLRERADSAPRTGSKDGEQPAAVRPLVS